MATQVLAVFLAGGAGLPGACSCVSDTLLAARGKSLASHRDGRGASRARRDDREYREYLSEEQRSPRGCIARRMQPDFHHGLSGPAMAMTITERRVGAVTVLQLGGPLVFGGGASELAAT